MAYFKALFVLAAVVAAVYATDDGSWHPGKYDAPGTLGYAGYAGAPAAYAGYAGWAGAAPYAAYGAYAAAPYAAYGAYGAAAYGAADDGSWFPGKYEPASYYAGYGKYH